MASFLQALPEGEPGTGVPPAARGSRRTNHVCCIKVCYNLLSPNNPWKMCDSCRLRDRTARRIKALRDSGVPVDPLPPRARSPPKSEGEKKSTKKKKGKKKAVDKGEEGERMTNEPRQDEPVGSSSVLQVKETQAAPLVIFMDPLVAEQTQSHIVRF